jgi:hypothetical protein
VFLYKDCPFSRSRLHREKKDYEKNKEKGPSQNSLGFASRVPGDCGVQTFFLVPLKLECVCVEDFCMYLLYYSVVLYHASQLYVSYIRYTDLLVP